MQEVVPKLQAEIAALVAADAVDGAAPPPVPPDRLARLDTRLARIQAATALEAAAAAAEAAKAAAADPPELVTMPPAPDPIPAPAPDPKTQYNFTDPSRPSW